MKMKIAWSKNLEMKRREDRFQECGQNDQNSFQEYCEVIKKVKRYRSAFTTEQVNFLEKEFRKHPYIGNLRRKDVANVLNIPERAVKIWFQNRRMKEKKDTIIKDTTDGQNQANTDGIDELLPKSASVANEPSLPVVRTNEVKQHVNEVASDLRINKSLPVFTSTKKEVPITKFSKPNYSISSANSGETTSENTFFNRDKHKSDFMIKYENNNAPVLEVSPDPHKMSPIFSSSSTSNVPQDLSTFASNTVFDRMAEKSDQEPHERTHVRVSTENLNVPLFLKGYYAQPYIPPGNMIWKPINVAPIMSTGLPAVTMANSSPQQSNVPTRSCTCNCHLKQNASPMVFQQSSLNPPVQYVITALPLQNHTNKF